MQKFTPIRLSISKYHFRVEEGESHILIASESEERYFMIQKPLDFDLQDRELGIDTYYVELNGQGNSQYGGIDLIDIKGEGILIMMGEQEIVLQSGAQNIDIDTVHENLQKLISG